jgi:hypothetical protein
LPGGIFNTTFFAIDSGCVFSGVHQYPFVIVVGDTGSVWPGDANDDLVANNMDILALGLGFGATGTTRPFASNAWIGQASPAWMDTIPGPVDLKYVDCTGDGVVDANDTLPIQLNYGLTHTKRHSPLRITGADPALRFVLDVDSANVGDTITASILLGDSLLPGLDVYGAAFSILYDPAAVDSSSFSLAFVPSWLSSGGATLQLTRNHPTVSICDAAQVRTTHNTASGWGIIARASIVLVDNIDGKRNSLDSLNVHFDFSNVRIIGLDGQTIPISVAGDSLMVYQLSVDRPGATHVHPPVVYPVPAHGFIRVIAQGHQIIDLELNDLAGRLVQQWQGNDSELLEEVVDAIPAGIYLLRIHTDQGSYTQKIVLE